MIVLAEFNTNQGRTTGEVVKMNIKTLWVRFKEFEKEKVKDFVVPKYATIKRHAIKHNVKIKVEV